MTASPRRLGFVCVRNAGRSQMAAAFARREVARRGLEEDVVVLVGGTRPAETVHEVVIEAMREIGMELSDQVPRRINDTELASCDVVVTMGCSTLELEADTEVRDWDLHDPDGLVIEAVRSIRDDIEGRVCDLLDELVTPEASSDANGRGS